MSLIPYRAIHEAINIKGDAFRLKRHVFGEICERLVL